VIRRYPCLLAVLAAALIVSAWAVPALADDIGTVDYTLTVSPGTTIANPGQKPSDNTTLGQVVVNGINSGQFPQVVASIDPTNSVVPTQNGSVSPLTILPGSSGFDPDGLVDSLSTDHTKLGLIFFNSGISSGGVLNFALSVDKTVSSTPPVLTSLTPGVSIALEKTPSSPPTTTPVTGGSNPVTVNTPEPLSLLVWSALAGLGLVRVRRLRHAVPAAA
jgi:hypothetical protein